MNLFRGSLQDFHALFTRFSWPKLKGILMGSSYENTIKKAMKKTLKNSQLVAHETV